ncbi:MAG TPA: peroxidase [Actinomycetota bacterium]|nr:peroxidase [Actinomycetota bacterium]
MTLLDRGNIQGFVLRGYGMPYASYLFVRFDDPDSGRRWLSDVTDDVITAAPWSVKPQSGINLAFTFSGLAALGVPSSSLGGFPQEFRDGMAARAAELGDTGASAPEKWEEPFGLGHDVHGMVMVSAQNSAALEAHDASIRTRIDVYGGITLLGAQIGASLATEHEHFGFKDTISQPPLEGSGIRPLPGGGALDGKGWRPIRAGEFILGYPDEEGVLPPAPTPDQLAANGTYLVYRKLYQDVAAYRRQVDAAAARFPGSRELLEAKIMGRWPDGTPLPLAPDAPDDALADDRTRNNDFTFGDDPQGLVCPVGSHVRRANPRASLPFGGVLVNRHRMIRRGIPYGDPLPEGAPDDGADRGLIWTSLHASIERQFEFVQSQWMNDGNPFGIGDDQDVVAGTQNGPHPRKMTVPGTPPFLVGDLTPVVVCRGGEYFFTPGINGLHYIAAIA